jgi:hypothetical protein
MNDAQFVRAAARAIGQLLQGCAPMIKLWEIHVESSRQLCRFFHQGAAPITEIAAGSFLSIIPG